MYLKSLPEHNRSIKEEFLSLKASDESDIAKGMKVLEYDLDSRVRRFKQESGLIKNLNPQVVNDYAEIRKLPYAHAATRLINIVMTRFHKNWNYLVI